MPENIAEAFKKTSVEEKIHHLGKAQDFLEKTHYYLILASDLGYGNTSQFMLKVKEITRLLKEYSDSINNQ